MEIKETERIVVAKPVPSRPKCSTFGPLSELLAGAINASPPNVCSETAVVAIKPKTVRFNPLVNSAPPNQVELSRTTVCDSSDNIPKSDSQTTVIYKPLAKLASKTTVSLLANMGNFNSSLQHTSQSIGDRVQHPKQDKLTFRSQISSNSNLIMPPHKENDQSVETSKMASQNLEEDTKSLTAAAGDRASYDGYNWRKYGQKQVKGSEYPRSYYKCTHPNCPVKKKVERSFEGHIAEIVYKREHNHPKPQSPKRSSSGTQELELVSDGTGQDISNRVRNNHLNERNEGSDSRVENQNEVGLIANSTFQGKAPLPTVEHMIIRVALVGNVMREGRDWKQSMMNPEIREAGMSEQGIQEPRIVVQSSADSEILSDGFQWKKYGQNVVKGNPYPRSYYRCTNLKCNVRKHVERASDDPRAFITTYEGKHNH